MRNLIHIFLDFNGVLDGTSGHYGGVNFNPECVEAFNAIAKNYDTKIIIISSWRYNYSLDELAKIITKHGMSGTVIAKTTTDHIDGSTRGDEIQQWRNENYTHDIPMLILEDVACISPMEHLCVRPQPHTGLALSDVPRAIQILEDQIREL